MKISDFIVLNDKEKKDILLHQGVLVGKRRTNKNIVFLFHLHNYYIELLCNLRSRQAEEVCVLTSENLLSPYLEAISLESLSD